MIEPPQETLRRHAFVRLNCACGAIVEARSDWRTTGTATSIVRRHNRTVLHRAWRERGGLEA